MSLRPGIFVTGTDTGVGKSAVAGALAGAFRLRGLDVGIMKPVQTGAPAAGAGRGAPDAEFLAAAAGLPPPDRLVCPVRLAAPLAPSSAAALEGAAVDVDALLADYRELSLRHAALIVEGAGGLCVPIAGRYLMSDLARDMGLPLLVVARPALGTINHTTLTVHFARAAGLRVLGVVINNFPARPGDAELDAAAAIEQAAGVEVLAVLDHDPALDVEGCLPGSLAAMVERAGLAERLLPALRP